MTLWCCETIREFSQKWFHICDEADGLQWLPLDRSFHGRRINIYAYGLHVVREEGS
jgi:hypothetical protein